MTKSTRTIFDAVELKLAKAFEIQQLKSKAIYANRHLCGFKYTGTVRGTKIRATGVSAHAAFEALMARAGEVG